MFHNQDNCDVNSVPDWYFYVFYRSYCSGTRLSNGHLIYPFWFLPITSNFQKMFKYYLLSNFACFFDGYSRPTEQNRWPNALLYSPITRKKIYLFIRTFGMCANNFFQLNALCWLSQFIQITQSIWLIVYKFFRFYVYNHFWMQREQKIWMTSIKLHAKSRFESVQCANIDMAGNNKSFDISYWKLGIFITNRQQWTWISINGNKKQALLLTSDKWKGRECKDL